MRTFKHSGDLGDIIMSLPTIRALGGGELYLNLNNEFKTKLNENSLNVLKGVLELQSYISKVDFWNGQKIDYNLDEFRKHIKYNNLADSHLAAFNLPFKERDEKWLEIEPSFIKPTIISRSCRYQSNHIFWENFLNESNLNDICFIGHEIEHRAIEYAFSKNIRYLKTPTLLDAAKAISASKLVVCNQSAIYCLAEAMKKNLIQEVYRMFPAAIFQREGAKYV